MEILDKINFKNINKNFEMLIFSLSNNRLGDPKFERDSCPSLTPPLIQ